MFEITCDDEGTGVFCLYICCYRMDDAHAHAASSNGVYACMFPWHIIWAQSDSNKLKILVSDVHFDGKNPGLQHPKFASMPTPLLFSCSSQLCLCPFKLWDRIVTLESGICLSHLDTELFVLSWSLGEHF